MTTARNRLPLALLIFALWAVVYLGTNRFHLREPRLLPMTWVDANVPFVPATVWMYDSAFLYFAAVYLLMREDLDALDRYYRSFVGLVLASGLIFLIWPTSYPRGLYPLPADLNAATAAALELLRRADTPANCCPSLHVSGVCLSAFVVFDRKKRGRTVFFAVWAALIALTTLTTKQHYLLDAVSGFAMAVFFYRLFRRPA
jgi:hypothetical protein